MNFQNELSYNNGVAYSKKQEIFTDLDLTVDLMDALLTIFDYIGPFKFFQDSMTIKSSKIKLQDEGEHTFNGIKFNLKK